MSSLLQTLSRLFSSRKSQSQRISKVCAVTLKELGLSVGGNVFQLTNSKGKSGWLVSLHVPERFSISPTDTLALKLFLTKRIETALGMKPKSLALVLSISNEAKRLPFGESAIDAKWVKSRIPVWLSAPPKSGLKAPPVARSSAPPQFAPSTLAGFTATDLPEVLRPNAEAIGAAPKSLPAKEQEARLEKLLATFSDDEHYEVLEASMTDFDRALH